MLRRPDASLYPARPICYADDLQSFASSLPGLQDTAILVSICAMVFNLTIAVHKLRAFHYCGLSAPPEDPEALLVYSCGVDPARRPDSHQRHLQEPRGGIPCQPGGLHLPTPHEAKTSGRHPRSFHQESVSQVYQSCHGKVFVRQRRIRRYSLLVVPPGM